ncbi:hypothetical protein JCM11641_005967 [Rhodosporidiobolus odoratus]
MCTSSQNRHRLPSIRSIPVLAAHLPPLTSPSPAMSARTSSSYGRATSMDLTEDSSTAAEEDGSEEEGKTSPIVKASSRLGRKLPNKACGPCRNSHTSHSSKQKHHTECGAARPCGTCVRRGRAHLCIDVPSRRGQKARNRNASLASPPTTISTRPPLSRPVRSHSPHNPLSSESKAQYRIKISTPPLRHPLFRHDLSDSQFQQHLPLVVSHICSASPSSIPPLPYGSFDSTVATYAPQASPVQHSVCASPDPTVPSSWSSKLAVAAPFPTLSTYPHLDLLRRRSSTAWMGGGYMATSTAHADALLRENERTRALA